MRGSSCQSSIQNIQNMNSVKSSFKLLRLLLNFYDAKQVILRSKLEDFILLYKQMNILSSQQMKQVEIKLLKMPLPPNIQLKHPIPTQFASFDTRLNPIMNITPQSTQLQIRKTVSLADSMRSIPLTDSNSVLKMFTMTMLSTIYQGRSRKTQSSDGVLLDSLKCSIYSPDVVLNSIKGSPITQSSNQMKALLASFFQLITSNQSNLSIDAFKLIQKLLQNNQHLVSAFVLFFRCILVALEVEGASNWRGNINGHACIQHLLDYFDLSYRQVGELFLLYEQGILLALKEKELVLGYYFENEGQREQQKKQMEIKSSIKFNMIQSLLLNVNNQEEATRKKKGIVDSDLKLFNFMLDSNPDQETAHPDSETPHFTANEQFQFGKKKKEDTYRPEQVRFQFQKLIKDESLQQIQPDDLINFNAQFEDAPSIKAEHHHQQQHQISNHFHQDKSQASKSLSNPPHLITLPKSRKSWVDQPNLHPNVNSLSQHRLKKAVTEIRNDSKEMNNPPNALNGNANFNTLNFGMCFCRQIRMAKNFCVSKVVNLSIVPPNRHKSPPKPFPTRGINFKNGRALAQEKSYTLNKDKSKQKRSQAGEERTPFFLKNVKKQISLQTNDAANLLHSVEQAYPASAKEITFRDKQYLGDQRNSGFLLGPALIEEDLAKMKISDSQPISKKFQFFSPSNRGGMTQSNSNWQTTHFYHQQRQIMSSPLNQAKSTCFPQPQPKSSSPLKVFAPVQTVVPNVYVNSNGFDNNSNIALKLSELHQKNQKLLREHHSPIPNRYQQGSGQGLRTII